MTRRLLAQTAVTSVPPLATSPCLISKRIRIYLLSPFINPPSLFSDSSFPRRVRGGFDVTESEVTQPEEGGRKKQKKRCCVYMRVQRSLSHCVVRRRLVSLPFSCQLLCFCPAHRRRRASSRLCHLAVGGFQLL